jgi:DNA helicase-2/ATP-dependent DNA helicase PcrA
LEKGIPYILIGGVKFYDRAEVKNLLSMVRVAYNPLDNISWERIEKNLGVRRMSKIKEFLANRPVENVATFDLMEELLRTSGYLEKFDKNDEEDRRRLENIEELKSVAQQFKDLGSFLENVALVQQEYSVQEKEKNNLNQAVKLMTIHASKGLEFDTVFLAGLEEGLLPHSQSLDDPERLEEERRLCYVAITRAKQHLYLTFTSQRLFFGKSNYNLPSRFLLDIPKDLLDENGWCFADDLDELSDEDFDDEWDDKW